MPLSNPKFYSIAEVISSALSNPVYDGRPAAPVEPITPILSRIKNTVERLKHGIANLPDQP